MPGKDRIAMAGYELQRLHVVRKALERVITQAGAAEVLRVTLRQVQRMVKRVREEGDRGVIHRGRGRKSNRAIEFKRRQKILELCRSKYKDFGPTLAAEKLFERDRIQVNAETLRLWLKDAGVAYPQRRKRAHRQWRERKNQFGEMVQMDGSEHDWFEGRGPRCVLMGYCEDATGNVYGKFYEYEGTKPALDSLGGYIRRYGIPASIYLDKHSTYRVNRIPTVEEQLSGEEALSQFGRAVKELGAELIYADSPQAKGRIERLFKTMQDRLIKELRLAGIDTIAQANEFLENYLPIYNRRYGVAAAKDGDLHRPRPSHSTLERILSIHQERVLRNDNTVSYDGGLYQIRDRIAGRRVCVEERLCGRLVFYYAGQQLSVKKLHPQLRRREQAACPRRKVYTGHTPADTHVWRQYQNNKPPAPQKRIELLVTTT